MSQEIKNYPALFIEILPNRFEHRLPDGPAKN